MLVKCSFVLFVTVALVSTAIASPYLHTGSSNQYRNQDNLGNYAFGYKENHATGGTFRRESGDAWGNKVGSYGLQDADGRMRVVNYVADGHGFRAAISSNEPGVAPSILGAATISKPEVAIHSHPVLHAAPAYAAPVLVPAPVYAHHNHYAPAAAAIVGPAAYAPTVHSHPGLLAAPSIHYGGHSDLHYPIRR